ncbi:MAG TPA: chemotaxis protein CheD [Conexibacter sp.]|nr:chemotaxis protein CheD [Conexibacter sp.]
MKVVRMGELAVSAAAEDELVSMGLGSCVGVALVDRERGIAGLAHVMLPEANAAYSAPAKFADRAVPALLASTERLGARRERTVAVLAGGAQMFAGNGRTAGVAGLDLGARNEAAVRTALAEAGIPVRAAATGGDRGRTVRVCVGDARVTVKEAGGEEQSLWHPAAPADDLVEIS